MKRILVLAVMIIGMLAAQGVIGGEASGVASDRIQIIAGKRAASHQTRVATVHSLGKNLTSTDIEGMYTFLKSRTNEHPDETALSFNAIKNDTLQALIAQDNLPSDLLPQILAMYRDPQMDTLWRDYCLQHLVLYYERRWKPTDPNRLDDVDRQMIVSVYEEALSSKQFGFAGTALLGLARLAEQYPELNQAKVAQQAAALVKDDTVDPATRITAMGLCGHLGRKDILPTARVWAQTGENTALRLASIGTLGLIGVKHDLELLQDLAASDDASVKKAAEMAIKRLQKRKS